MRLTVEAWSPEYGGELDFAPEDETREKVDTTCETGSWEPVAPQARARAPRRAVFVDGTRRVDARVWFGADGSAPVPGVAGSLGIGAVACPVGGANGNGERALVAHAEVQRFLLLGEGRSVALSAGPGLEYGALSVPGRSVDHMVLELHNQMRAREAGLARALGGDGTLVFVDGPLAVMRPGAEAIVGFIKAHHRRYLPPEEEAVLTQLSCGERTPLFAFGDPRPRYSWYLRLCERAPASHGWHGLVRCETPGQLGVQAAREVADAATAILPSYASLPHWDARAPQNLVPVAGLERRLRHLLGDRDLVLRLIRSAARRTGHGG